MTSFIRSWESKLRPYGFRPMKHPVIFIVDDDDGGSDVRKAAEKVAGTDLDMNAERYFPIRDNLYLVLTPPKANGEPTAIEDCFPQTVLNTKLDGKSFNMKKKHGDESTYGKQVFAEKIVVPGVNKIDFSGFEPLLQAVSKALVHYRSKLAANGQVKKSA